MIFINYANFYCISSRVEKTGLLYGCFKIGPFFRQQSLTFANTLRRTLLADQSKLAFDAIQIYGVEHEYSNLSGVRESIIDILLNLQQIKFQVTKPITKPQVAFVNFCGPGILKAQHIHLPPKFKCLNPLQYIATLEMDGQLTFKLFFSPNWEKFHNFLDISTSRFDVPTSRFDVPTSLLDAEASLLDFKIPFWKKNQTIRRLSFVKQRLVQMKSSITCKNFYKKIFHRSKQALEFHSPKIQLIRRKRNKKIRKYSFQIQENFLFFKNSLCAIEKVNYTIQSQIEENRLSESSKDGSKTTTNFDFKLEQQHTVSKNKEFILFEIWTNGSLHPQTAILKAINEILFDMFSYSWLISNTSKILQFKQHQLDISTSLLSLKTNASAFMTKKFINLEIGNFYFNLETYLFLKKKKIYRIIDFSKILKIDLQNENLKVRKTIFQFQTFINSVLQNLKAMSELQAKAPAKSSS